MANSPPQKLSRKGPAVERCWTLVGRRQGSIWSARRMRPTQGALTSVSFDAAWVLAREESHGDVIGFYHTHPSGNPSPSRRDNRTMRAWTSSFGKPLLCLIESDGLVRAFAYGVDSSKGKQLAVCELFPRGVVIACGIN